MRSGVLWLMLLFPAALFAQSNEADLQARLLNKPLYLRGLWKNDKLAFDSAGALKGRSEKVSFTLAGIDIESVRLEGGELLLQGRRMGLTFPDQGLTRQAIPLRAKSGPDGKAEEIHLDIAGAANGDYGVQLDAILTANLIDLAPALPDEWQNVVQQFPVAGDHLSPAPRGHKHELAPRVGGSVVAPVVVSQAAPDFSEYARRAVISGNSLIYLQVDEKGTPTHLRIVKPLGMGLDEKAVEAVRSYRFKPATRDGVPMVVEMNVDVNFDIF